MNTVARKKESIIQFFCVFSLFYTIIQQLFPVSVDTNRVRILITRDRWNKLPGQQVSSTRKLAINLLFTYLYLLNNFSIPFSILVLSFTMYLFPAENVDAVVMPENYMKCLITWYYAHYRFDI